MSDAPATPGATPAAAPDATVKPDAPKEGAPAVAQPAAPKKYKLALEGDDEREYELDAIRANFLKGKNAAQMMSKADQRLREAHEKEKRWGGLSAKAKDKPLEAIREFLKESGVDVDLETLGEQMVLPRIQREMLTDEQRREVDATRRAETAEARLKELDDKRQADEDERKVMEHQNRLGKVCLDALQRVGLPESSGVWAVKRMAALLDKVDDLNESGHEIQLSPDDIATMVKDEFLGEHRSFTSNLTGEQIVQLYGEDFVKKVRTYDLARLKEGRGLGLKQPPAAPTNPTPSNGHNKKYMDETEWAAELKRRIQEG